jgi:hypothetical protein
MHALDDLQCVADSDPAKMSIRSWCSYRATRTTAYFDLDCIRPWLKLNSTCPLDRKELLKKKQPVPPPIDDDDGEYDDMYA